MWFCYKYPLYFHIMHLEKSCYFHITNRYFIFIEVLMRDDTLLKYTFS